MLQQLVDIRGVGRLRDDTRSMPQGLITVDGARGCGVPPPPKMSVWLILKAVIQRLFDDRKAPTQSGQKYRDDMQITE